MIWNEAHLQLDWIDGVKWCGLYLITRMDIFIMYIIRGVHLLYFLLYLNCKYRSYHLIAIGRPGVFQGARSFDNVKTGPPRRKPRAAHDAHSWEQKAPWKWKSPRFTDTLENFERIDAAGIGFIWFYFTETAWGGGRGTEKESSRSGQETARKQGSFKISSCRGQSTCWTALIFFETKYVWFKCWKWRTWRKSRIIPVPPFRSNCPGNSINFDCFQVEIVTFDHSSELNSTANSWTNDEILWWMDENGCR